MKIFKNNKNVLKVRGFTLIELLAVIIILALLYLFVMPRVSDLVKEGNSTNEELTRSKILEAAKDYAHNYDTDFLNDLVNVGDTKEISKNDLINSKLIDSSDLENLSFEKIIVVLKEDNKIEYSIK